MLPHIRRWIDTLAQDILLQEALANEAAELAALARDDASVGFAVALVNLSRQHRVRALQLRGDLAALAVDHPHALNGED